MSLARVAKNQIFPKNERSGAIPSVGADHSVPAGPRTATSHGTGVRHDANELHPVAGEARTGVCVRRCRERAKNAGWVTTARKPTPVRAFSHDVSIVVARVRPRWFEMVSLFCNSMVFHRTVTTSTSSPASCPSAGGRKSSSAGTVPAAAAAKAAAVARLDPASSAPRRLAGVNRDRAAGGVGGAPPWTPKRARRRERFQIERLGRERRGEHAAERGRMRKGFLETREPAPRARRLGKSSVPLAALGRRRFPRGAGVPKHLRCAGAPSETPRAQAFQASSPRARVRGARRLDASARAALGARRARRTGRTGATASTPPAPASRNRAPAPPSRASAAATERPRFRSRRKIFCLPVRRVVDASPACPRRRRARARRARAARPRTPPGRSVAGAAGRSGGRESPPPLAASSAASGRVGAGRAAGARARARERGRRVAQCVARRRVVFHRVVLFLRSVGRRQLSIAPPFPQSPRSSVGRRRRGGNDDDEGAGIEAD